MGIIYKSLRLGQDGRPFHLYKFRTMRFDGGSPTASFDDPRLTRIGKWLRRFKLDELPTLFNILNGDMAIVGPRPDVPSEYEDIPDRTRCKVFSMKPGLISPATLWNINEDEALMGEADPHRAYTERIKPIKYRLNEWYVDNQSLWLDLKVIVATTLRFVGIRVEVFPKHLIE